MGKQLQCGLLEIRFSIPPAPEHRQEAASSTSHLRGLRPAVSNGSLYRKSQEEPAAISHHRETASVQKLFKGKDC